MKATKPMHPKMTPGDQICRAEVHDVDLLQLNAGQGCSHAPVARQSDGA
jgi:hypothetical protein